MNERVCSVDGCGKTYQAKGYCGAHYAHARKHGLEMVPLVREPRQAGCSVEGCGKPNRSNGLCEAHYQRLRRRGNVGGAETRVRRYTNTVCIADDCEKERRSGAWCVTHASRITRHGDPYVVLKPRSPAGEECRFWTGDEVTYRGMHQRVKKYRGRASTHDCAHCSGPARHWAYDRQDPDERTSDVGPYSVKVEHYLALCVRCHKRFDLAAIGSPRKSTKPRGPAWNRIEVDYGMVSALLSQGVTISQIARDADVSRNAVKRVARQLRERARVEMSA